MLFSIDGIEKIHNLSRDNSWDSFSYLLPVLGELFPDAIFRITLTPENIKYLNETIYFGQQLGFTNFNALPDGMDNNWTNEDYKIMKEQLSLLWHNKKLRGYFRPFYDYKNRLNFPNHEVQCCDGKTTIAILPNGKISLCGEQTENDVFIIGDIEQGISEEKIKNFWKQIIPCPIHCKAYPICSKERCFSRRMFNYGDLNHKINNHCRWYNIIEEVMNNG